MPKKLLIIAALIVVVAFALSRVDWGEPQGGSGPTSGGAIPEEIVRHFAERLQGRFVALVGQPIEGFTPDMFTQVWELEERDFDGADAINGRYEFRNGTLSFVQRETNVVSSADGAVTAQGMGTLLQNASARLRMPIRNGGDVDHLLGMLLEKTEGRNTALIRGKVDIGPICPVERPGEECKPSPEVYASRFVLLFQRGDALYKTGFKPDGTYEFKVPPGEYRMDIAKTGIDRASGLPRDIEIKAGEVLDINFSIDTGIR